MAHTPTAKSIDCANQFTTLFTDLINIFGDSDFYVKVDGIIYSRRGRKCTLRSTKNSPLRFCFSFLLPEAKSDSVVLPSSPADTQSAIPTTMRPNLQEHPYSSHPNAPEKPKEACSDKPLSSKPSPYNNNRTRSTDFFSMPQHYPGGPY